VVDLVGELIVGAILGSLTWYVMLAHRRIRVLAQQLVELARAVSGEEVRRG
jgi:hypothetical protein